MAKGASQPKLMSPITDAAVPRSTKPTNAELLTRRMLESPIDMPADHTNSWNLSPGVVTRLTALSDAIVIGLSGYLIYLWYLDADNPAVVYYPLAIALGTLGVVSALSVRGLYGFDIITKPSGVRKKLIFAVLYVFAAVTVLNFALKTSEVFSRVWMFLWLGGACILLPLSRAAIAKVLGRMARHGIVRRNIAVYGNGILAEHLIDRIVQSHSAFLHIAGIFDDRLSRDHLPANDLLTTGNMDDLERLVRQRRIDQIIIALPWTAAKRIMQVRERLQRLPVKVGLAPGLVSYQFNSNSTQQLVGLPILELLRLPISDWDLVRKRFLDLTGALVLCACALPAMIVVALAVKLTSPGPILFRQKRYGFNNQLIDVLKFRTMYIDQQDDNAAKLATRDDPRVTPVGRVLRRWSLDELPQLFNVLTGEMSLVGPRPHATHAKAANRLYTELLENYTSRHRVKPGITGLAQIRGWRGETDTEEKLIRRVESDIEYIETWSLWLDIKILFGTISPVLRGENSY